MARLQRGLRSEHRANDVEEVADLAAPALDMAVAPPLAAIVIVRSHSQQGRGDLVAHLAEFRHCCDQAGGSDLAKPRHALDDLGEFGQMWRGLDHGRDRSLKFGNFEGDRLQEARLHLLHDLRRGVLAPVLQARLQLEQALTRLHDLHQLVTRICPSLPDRLSRPSSTIWRKIQRRAVGQNRPFACSGTLSGHKSTAQAAIAWGEYWRKNL
jgi:hypothetical protein